MNKNCLFNREQIKQLKKQAKANCEKYMRRGGCICYYREIRDKCNSCLARAILRAIGRPLIRKLPKWKKEQNERYEALKKQAKRKRREARKND